MDGKRIILYKQSWENLIGSLDKNYTRALSWMWLTLFNKTPTMTHPGY